MNAFPRLPPQNVAAAYDRFPEQVRDQLMTARRLVFEAAAAKFESVGPLTETLKWGEPAYLTEATKSGSTIRLGVLRSMPGRGAALFNCQTTLVDTFRAHFSDALLFEGNRAIVFPESEPLPTDALIVCFDLALTYHARKHAGRP